MRRSNSHEETNYTALTLLVNMFNVLFGFEFPMKQKPKEQ